MRLELTTRRFVAKIPSAAAAIVAGGCGMFGLWLDAPPLFDTGAPVATVDFESSALGQAPAGFSALSGSWSIADFPRAASGQQVLVQRGNERAHLEIGNPGGDGVYAEVAVRVLIGGAGAGVGCATGPEEGYVVKVEPGEKRVALYELGGSEKPVDTHDLGSVEGKREWARLGIRCRDGRVAAYLDGKPIVVRNATLGNVRLALVADPGITAQFDDLRYVID